VSVITRNSFNYKGTRNNKCGKRWKIKVAGTPFMTRKFDPLQEILFYEARRYKEVMNTINDMVR
jgi:hypothetical protein